ncbi:hypothetical protein [Pseudoalteromonas rubra]|nr:hypothetical protein [Pseudoalteromonas rubra]
MKTIITKLSAALAMLSVAQFSHASETPAASPDALLLTQVQITRAKKP